MDQVGLACLCNFHELRSIFSLYIACWATYTRRSLLYIRNSQLPGMQLANWQKLSTPPPSPLRVYSSCVELRAFLLPCPISLLSYVRAYFPAKPNIKRFPSSRRPQKLQHVAHVRRYRVSKIPGRRYAAQKLSLYFFHSFLIFILGHADLLLEIVSWGLLRTC